MRYTLLAKRLGVGMGQLQRICATGSLLIATTALGGTEIGETRHCGVGIILGSPTGLSGKCYVPDRSFGVDVALAYETFGYRNGTLYLHATALWHPMDLHTDDWGNVPWYVGVGPFFGTWQFRDSHPNFDNDWYIGVRTPVGIGIDFSDVPIQIYAEVSLLVALLPATDIDLGFGLGARYYF